MVDTSICALRMFLVLLSCHEPGLLDIIKSFIFVFTRKFNNFNYISQCYFNYPLTVDENTVINWVFGLSEEIEIKEQISIFHRFVNGNLKPIFLKVCKKTIEEESVKTHTEILCGLKLETLRNLIGIFHIMNSRPIIKDIDFMYLHNIKLQTIRIEATFNNEDYIRQNKIYLKSSEYPKYTRELIDCVDNEIMALIEIKKKLEKSQKDFDNYIREVLKIAENEIIPMLM